MGLDLVWMLTASCVQEVVQQEDIGQGPPDNLETVSLSPLRVSLPSPPASPVARAAAAQLPESADTPSTVSTQDPQWQSNKWERSISRLCY